MSKWLFVLKCDECGATYDKDSPPPKFRDGVEICFCGGRLDIDDVVDKDDER